MNEASLDIMSFMPLWLIFIITVVAIFTALMTGYYQGCRAADAAGAKESAPPIGSVVGAMMGLLAFLLALTFNSSSSRFETRKQLLVDDVNAINNTYHRADFLFEADRIQTKEVLREYVDLYISMDEDPTRFESLVARSLQIHSELWAIASKYAQNPQVSNTVSGGFATAVDQMRAVHTKRLVYALHYRIHPTIWIALFGVGLLSLGALGFLFGITGGKRYKVCISLAVCFGTILILIMDLERPVEGTIRIDTVPLQVLRAQME